MGQDEFSTGPPACVVEGSVLHALRLALSLLGDLGSRWKSIRRVHILAGSWMQIKAIKNWFTTGTLTLKSAVASETAQTLSYLKSHLQCPLLVGALPSEFLQCPALDPLAPPNLILATANRVLKYIIPQARNRWGPQLARLPWTKEELKAHLKRRYRSDESKLISLLATEGSTACKIHDELSLSRALIKSTLKTLDGSRLQQVTLASIACGTFFKYYNSEGLRLRVRCPLCQEVNSISHLQTHLAHKMPVTADMEEWTLYLSALATLVTPKSRILPQPIEWTDLGAPNSLKLAECP